MGVIKNAQIQSQSWGDMLPDPLTLAYFACFMVSLLEDFQVGASAMDREVESSSRQYVMQIKRSLLKVISLLAYLLTASSLSSTTNLSHYTAITLQLSAVDRA